MSFKTIYIRLGNFILKINLIIIVSMHASFQMLSNGAKKWTSFSCQYTAKDKTRSFIFANS